jgi:hypothetical protein
MSESNAVAAMKPLPKFMQPDPESQGPLCLALNGFLAGFLLYCDEVGWVPGFVPDHIYGAMAGEVMMLYQRHHGLTVDGGCGPETRAVLASDGLDLEEIANAVPGTTIFVQPDGSKIAWSLETGAVPVGPDPRQEDLPLDSGGDSMPACLR